VYDAVVDTGGGFSDARGHMFGWSKCGLSICGVYGYGERSGSNSAVRSMTH